MPETNIRVIPEENAIGPDALPQADPMMVSVEDPQFDQTDRNSEAPGGQRTATSNGPEAISAVEPHRLMYQFHPNSPVGDDGFLMQREVREKLLKASRIGILMSGPIGDVIESSGLFAGMLAAARKNSVSGNPAVTLFTRGPLYELYAPLAETGEIRVAALEPTQGTSALEQMERLLGQETPVGGNIFLIDLEAYTDNDPYVNMPTVQYHRRSTDTPSDVTAIKLPFLPAITNWRPSLNAATWHAAYVNKLLGLRGDVEVAAEEAHPFVPLPPHVETRYAAIMDELGAATNALQVALAVQSANVTKLYGPEQWKAVLASTWEQLKSCDTPPINFNIFLGPEESAYPGFRRQDFEQAFQGLRAYSYRLHLNFIQRSLPDAAVLLSQQAVVCGVDTGLMHLANALKVPLIALYSTQRLARVWGVSYPDTAIIASNYISQFDPRLEERRFDKNDFNQPGYNATMQSIPPEVIGHELFAVLSTSPYLNKSQQSTEVLQKVAPEPSIIQWLRQLLGPRVFHR